ncbi:hypothetical protein MHYP_G00303980 [Metynnis hypsauchen]
MISLRRRAKGARDQQRGGSWREPEDAPLRQSGKSWRPACRGESSKHRGDPQLIWSAVSQTERVKKEYKREKSRSRDPERRVSELGEYARVSADPWDP